MKRWRDNFHRCDLPSKVNLPKGKHTHTSVKRAINYWSVFVYLIHQHRKLWRPDRRFFPNHVRWSQLERLYRCVRLYTKSCTNDGIPSCPCDCLCQLLQRIPGRVFQRLPVEYLQEKTKIKDRSRENVHEYLPVTLLNRSKSHWVKVSLECVLPIVKNLKSRRKVWKW